MKPNGFSCAVSLVLVAIFIFSGCVKQRFYIQKVYPSSVEVNSPGLDIDAEVEIGESMVSTYRECVFPAIKLEKEVIHAGNYSGYAFTLTIPAGHLVARGEDRNGTFFQANQKLQLQINKVEFSNATGGVYVPKDDEMQTEIYWLSAIDEAPLKHPHSGIRFNPTIYKEACEDSKDSFRRELVYTGTSQNSISVLYREFLMDVARPAFSQELRYDLSQGDTIGFKRARFKVIKFTNTSIKYKVLKYLE